MSPNKRINVLVYSGNGVSPHALHLTLLSLRQHLTPSYAVAPISTSALLTSPWEPTCALLVFPGGADVPYCNALNGPGTARITAYVRSGGRFVGFCAGGYFASGECEFMKGDKVMEVMGKRELAFFPGVCRGLAFKGFKYRSEEGARAAEVEDKRGNRLRVYCNGGGVFVDAEKYKTDGVSILARYTERLDVDGGDGNAAVVLCKVGKGSALLTGPHPEFPASRLDQSGGGPSFTKVVEELERSDHDRWEFLKACLEELGLETNSQTQVVPTLSRIYLFCPNPFRMSNLLQSWKPLLFKSPTQSKCLEIHGEQNSFHIDTENFPSDHLHALQLHNLPTSQKASAKHASTSSSPDSDHSKPHILSIIHPTSTSPQEFSESLFYSQLPPNSTFGTPLLFSRTTSSTSTLLERNPSLLHTLPTGSTFTAHTQLLPRGRGSNAWVSPPGALMFSTVIHHATTLSPVAPVVFVQYLAAMATVRAIRAYSPAHAAVPVRVKWPNDVYVAMPPAGMAEPLRGEADYVKIGGVLVGSSWAGEGFALVVGVGLNVKNRKPTTGLDQVAEGMGVEGYVLERLLAGILGEFERLYALFCVKGWGGELEEIYYGLWLHSNQIVTIDSEGGARARIKGVTRDWGMLLAEELGMEDHPTGRMIALQSDSNSFDFFRGLIKRKV